MCIRAGAPKARTAQLNPRKADLRRWRETFAEKLRDLGIGQPIGQYARHRPGAPFKPQEREA